jgi:hypothetical protein
MRAGIRWVTSSTKALKAKANPHPNPLPEGEGADRGALRSSIDLNVQIDLRFGQAKITVVVASRWT